MSTEGSDITSREAIAAMRRSYGETDIEDLGSDPFKTFTSWLGEAAANPFIIEANAMVLSTLGSASDGNDAISSRTVLLKDISDGGFTFFTNYNSRKAQAIDLHEQVTLLFPWYAMERQVTISGLASKIERTESERYFASRPWSSARPCCSEHRRSGPAPTPSTARNPSSACPASAPRAKRPRHPA